jgi:hypothetical protein
MPAIHIEVALYTLAGGHTNMYAAADTLCNYKYSSCAIIAAHVDQQEKMNSLYIAIYI